MLITPTFHFNTKTKTEGSRNPTYAMFLKSRGFKNIKDDTHKSQTTSRPHPVQTKPDQTKDFILADLILELAF